jgi:hypothetical protein
MNERAIDQRADAARAQLRASVATRPIPPVGRVTSAAQPARGRGLGWRPLVAIGVAAACVAGVALVLHDDGHDTQPASGLPDARRVIDDLPAGFEATGAFGPGDGTGTPTDVWAGWWIADATLTQVASVMSTGPASAPSPIAGADYTPEMITSATIDGHDASLFDSIEQGVEGVRVLVLHGDTLWYSIAARGIADDALIELARATLDDTITADELPSGLELLGVAPAFWALIRSTGGDELPTGLCGVGYQRITTGSDGSRVLDAIALTTTPDTRMMTAQLALYFADRTQVPGTAYATAPFPGGSGVQLLMWQIGGVSYVMVGTVTVDELVTAAQSVRVPTDDEWAALEKLRDANVDSIGGSESSSVSAPATTAAATPTTVAKG